MKINLNQEILGIDGKSQIPETPNLPISESNPPMTLRGICIHAMLTPVMNQYDENGRLVVKGDDVKLKIRKFNVFEKLRDAKKEKDGTIIAVLESDDVTLLKDWIMEFQPQLICGQCVKMLEDLK